MSNPSRRKGTDFENDLRDNMLRKVFPHVERAPLKGILDAGDFVNTRHLLIEAKKRKVWRLPEWIRVTAAKARRQQRPWAIFFAGDRRSGPVELRDTFVVTTADTFIALLGYVYGKAIDDDPFAGLYGEEEQR